jgi:hypothetical protein
MVAAALARDEWLMRGLAAAIYPLRDNLMVLQLNGKPEFPEPKRRHTGGGGGGGGNASAACSHSSGATSGAAAVAAAAEAGTVSTAARVGDDEVEGSTVVNTTVDCIAALEAKTGPLVAELADGKQVAVKLRLPSSARIKTRHGGRKKKKKRGRQSAASIAQAQAQAQSQMMAHPEHGSGGDHQGIDTADARPTSAPPAAPTTAAKCESSSNSSSSSRHAGGASASASASASIMEIVGVDFNASAGGADTTSTAAGTADPDLPLSPTIFDARLTFLDTCQTNNLQFDQLRRAKHTSTVLLGIHVVCLSRHLT